MEIYIINLLYRIYHKVVGREKMGQNRKVDWGTSLIRCFIRFTDFFIILKA